jgi:DNA-binding MarR family transcriptional regulator
MTQPKSKTSEPLPKELVEFLSRQRGSIGFNAVLWGKYYAGPLYALMEMRFGIFQDDFAVLASLYDYDGLTAKTICTMTGRPKNSISRGVTRLLAAGRIRSVTNQNDRREAMLYMLSDGRRLYERIMPLCKEREELMLGSLTQAERQHLEEILIKLVHAQLFTPVAVPTTAPRRSASARKDRKSGHVAP